MTDTPYRAALAPSLLAPSLLADADIVLADLDGTLVAGGRALPGATLLASTLGERLWIVSNNGADTQQGLAERLAGLGLPVPAERIVLAGVESLRALALRSPGARVMLFAPPPLLALADGLGLRRDMQAPEVVFLGRDESFGFPQMQAALNALHRGARLVASNLDGAHPGPDGAPVLETGALVAALLSARPRTPIASIGKPATDLLHLALRRAGARAERAFFIGDNPATDGAAAAALNIAFLQVDPRHGPAPLLSRTRDRPSATALAEGNLPAGGLPLGAAAGFFTATPEGWQTEGES